MYASIFVELHISRTQGAKCIKKLIILLEFDTWNYYTPLIYVIIGSFGLIRLLNLEYHFGLSCYSLLCLILVGNHLPTFDSLWPIKTACCWIYFCPCDSVLKMPMGGCQLTYLLSYVPSWLPIKYSPFQHFGRESRRPVAYCIILQLSIFTSLSLSLSLSIFHSKYPSSSTVITILR